MNFELEDKLSKLLKNKSLDEAIEVGENELRKIADTDFHQIIGKNLNHLITQLSEYIKDFDKSTTNLLNKKRGFVKSIFSSKKIKPIAYYCEMNGFTINYDRWFIDLFSYEEWDLEDWEWLSDFYDSTTQDFTITGFEEIQKLFQDVHENNKLNDPNTKQAYDICELLIILRLQELFRDIYQVNKEKWTEIPMFITAHDSDMIYQAN